MKKNQDTKRRCLEERPSYTWIETYRETDYSVTQSPAITDLFVWIGEVRLVLHDDFYVMNGVVHYMNQGWPDCDGYLETPYCLWTKIVHPVVLPDGFALTGEYRIPEAGEYCIDAYQFSRLLGRSLFYISYGDETYPQLILWKPRKER